MDAVRLQARDVLADGTTTNWSGKWWFGLVSHSAAFIAGFAGGFCCKIANLDNRIGRLEEALRKIEQA